MTTPSPASPLIVSVAEPRLQHAVGDIEGVEFVTWDLTTPPPVDRIDIVVPPYMKATELLGVVRDCSPLLVQSQSIGYDGVAATLPAGVPFANAATVHETSTAELTLALILASQRGIPEFVRAAEQGRWAPEFRPALADRRVLLVGVGGVGRAIDARLAPFEVDVTRVGRTRRTETAPDGTEYTVYGIDDLPTLLPEAEILVIGVPLGPETTGLIGADELAALPDGALVVNIARGPVLDTDALLSEVTTGRLRAALDVTDPEPLPQGHPLLLAPGVLISPHVGGASSAMLPRMAQLLRRQIDHALAGEPFENLIELSPTS